MSGFDDIKEHMDVIGADGVHVGTVDRIDGDRIKLTRKDSGEGSHKAIIISSRAASSPTSRETRCGCRPMPMSR